VDWILQIKNDGAVILEANFWHGPVAAAGKHILSLNAGAFRLLLASEDPVREMATAEEIVISRGPWPAQGLDDAFELMFEDGSDSPYALWLSATSLDRLPAAQDVGREFRFSAWRPGPRCVLRLPCWYRLASALPCLKRRS